jgi:Fic family protein
MLFQTPSLTPIEARVVDRIVHLRERLRSATHQAARWTGLLRRSAFARAVQASNAIEGINVTLDDAAAVVAGDDPLEADRDTAEAVRGYRDAMTFALQASCDPYFRYSVEVLKSMQFMIVRHDLSKHPGRWRPGSVVVRSTASGEVVYEGPHVDLVPGLMDALVQGLNTRLDAPALIRAAMAHLNLVMIHPFSDGNGRMGRALQTLVLAREGILEPEFCSIEEFLGRHTDRYYGVLATVGQGAWHPGNDARPWVQFCLDAHFHQANRLLRRTREYERLSAEIFRLIAAHGLPERAFDALFEAALGWRVRNSTYRLLAGITDNLASRDLRTLSDRGLLVPRGEKRGRFYVAAEPLVRLRHAVREPRASETVSLFAQPELPF